MSFRFVNASESDRKLSLYMETVRLVQIFNSNAEIYFRIKKFNIHHFAIIYILFGTGLFST